MAKLTGKAKAKFLARMKKGRKAAKKSGGKKKKSKSTNVKRLEQRIADLEEKFHQKLKHYDDHDSRELDFEGDQIRKTRIKLDDELKRELESGRNG